MNNNQNLNNGMQQDGLNNNSNNFFNNGNSNVGNQQLAILNNMNQVNNNNGVVLGTIDNTSYVETLGNFSSNNNNMDNEIKYYDDNMTNNTFINNDMTNNTMLNDLNINDNYNNAYNSYHEPDYINDPKVQENIHPKEKKTIKITEEAKTFVIIVFILLLFTFVMPFLLDFINKIRFH